MAKGTFIARKVAHVRPGRRPVVGGQGTVGTYVTYRGYVEALKYARPTLGALPSATHSRPRRVRQINRTMARAGKSKATMTLTLLGVKAVFEETPFAMNQ